MSNTEAKFVLEAYRANGRDAGDRMFADALDQARNDPALGAWLARAQAHDEAVAGKLREIAPPPGLRAAILAGARASRSPGRRWQVATSWLAAAAAIALVTSVSFLLRPNPAAAEEARFATFALEDTAHGKHGGHGEPTSELGAMLSRPTTHVGASLPVDFAALRTSGCRTVSFAGHEVLEVCFNRNGEWFHCYIANRADFPSFPARATAVFAQQAQLASASWSDATHHFVIVAENGMEAVRRLL